MGRKRPVTDHTGADHPSVSAMCRAWNIPLSAYNTRVRCGWPMEDALTAPLDRHVRRTVRAKPATDHAGRTWPSERAMCRHYGIEVTAYRARIRSGMPVGRALTEPLKAMTRHGSAEGPEGRYGTVGEMCAAHGISESAYYGRLRRGIPASEALAGGYAPSATACTDWAGREYPSLAALSKFLGLPKHLSLTGYKDGTKTLPEICASKWTRRRCGRYYVEKCVAFPWFLVSDGDARIVMHFDALLDERHASGPDPLAGCAVPKGCPRPIGRVRWPVYKVRMPDGTESEMDYRSILGSWTAAKAGNPRADG